MNMTESDAAPAPVVPPYVRDLQASYGPPSQEAFGGATFFDKPASGTSLEAAALEKYRYFVGDLWEKYGEDAWMGPWSQVYTRPKASKGDIVAELRAIKDPAAAVSVPLVLDVAQNADAARAALAAAFDDADVADLAVFTIGDGGAMSGLIVAGRRGKADEVAYVAVLMD
jgi:hypothetical protein